MLESCKESAQVDDELPVMKSTLNNKKPSNITYDPFIGTLSMKLEPPIRK